MTTTLGDRYELEEAIGHGAMASVWRATDTVLHRHVAVKRLHRRVLGDPELLARFEREAAVVARLTHPAIVRLLDRGEDDDGPFLVFELVEGQELKALVARDGRLHARTAANLCAQVARGLDHAHEHGVVHRDITARNILVTPDGHAKVADFGVAHEIAGDGLTGTGAMVGTSEYLSPEQAGGVAVDRRSDVYALGVVLYECLTGELPFTGAGPLAVAIRHLSEPVPDPRDIAPDVPEALAVAVLTATAKDPARRYPDAGRLAEVLEDVAAGRGEPPPPAAPPPDTADHRTTGRMPAAGRRRRPGLAAGAAVVAAAAAGVALVATGVVDFGGGGGAGDLPASRLAKVPVAGVVDWDPGGGDGENGALAANAADGDPATLWRTEGYLVSGDLAALPEKLGVGLRFTLARPAAVRAVIIDTPTSGAVFQVRAGAAEEVRGQATTRGGRQVVRLSAGTPQAEWIVWFTNVPRGSDGKFRAEVGEVEFRAAANGS